MIDYARPRRYAGHAAPGRSLQRVRLAKAAEHNCSYVHPDVTRLDELGPIERTQGGLVLAPYESVGILLSLAQAA